MSLSKSQIYAQRARRLLVGRDDAEDDLQGNADVHSLIAARAKGSRLYDLNDHEYTDYYLGGGVHILGHANHNVVLCAKKYAERGLGFGLTTQAEIDLAAFLAEHIPSLEKVHCVSSPGQAVLEAIRIARAATGRKEILRVGGRTDGSCDFPYNDAEALESFMDKYAGNLAGVIFSPVAIGPGLTQAQPGFVKKVFELTRRYGMLFICDEGLTGFRGFAGCEHTLWDIRPDMVCLGSVIGAGFSFGVLGGRADVMRYVGEGDDGHDRSDAHPVIARAGLMALRLMNDGFYRALNGKAERFADAMNAFFEDQGGAVRVERYYSMMSLRFVAGYKETDTNVGSSAMGAQRYRIMQQYLLSRGIFFPGSEMEPFFLCGKHSKKDLAVLCQELELFFKEKRHG